MPNASAHNPRAERLTGVDSHHGNATASHSEQPEGAPTTTPLGIGSRMRAIDQDFADIRRTVAAFAAGDPVVVVDDENRENEGDLIVAGALATPETVGMLVRYTSGLICAPITQERAEEMQLPLMVTDSEDPKRTAYTISCDARFGTSTGISAHDRCAAVRVLADETSGADQLQRPGHVLPLIARPGGVLERAGHTEAAIDLCRLAGLPLAAAIGEVVHEDTSGRKDTLARMVRIEERRTLLRRSAEDGDAAGTERPVVANADLLVIVTALADPEPRPRMIDRYLVAAYDAGMEPLLILTKSDLADAAPLLALYEPLGVHSVATRLDHSSRAETSRTDGDGVKAVRELIAGLTSVFVGHSGVGKSTLINALVPGADRVTGDVNEVTGRGRHTSTNLQALELPGGGWVIDTPGVRSFGVAHVSSADVLRGFPDLTEIAEDCPRGCTHEAGVIECALDEWAADSALNPAERERRRARVDSFRRLLAPALEAEDPTTAHRR